MKVKAAPGLQVPKEGKPREYITDAAAQVVADSAYYLRLAGCGDLVVSPDNTQKSIKRKAITSTTKVTTNQGAQ